MSTVLNWDKSFKVDTNSFHPKNPNRGIPQLDSDCNIYTDGSRLGPNQSGAAVSVWKKVNHFGHDLERPLPGHGKNLVPLRRFFYFPL